LLRGSPHERHQGDVHEEDVVATQFVTNLTGCFDERLAFDIPHCSTNFGDDDVGAGVLMRLKAHSAFDFIGDVRNDLDGVAEVLAAPFPPNNFLINLACGDVCGLGKIDV